MAAKGLSTPLAVRHTYRARFCEPTVSFTRYTLRSKFKSTDSTGMNEGKWREKIVHEYIADYTKCTMHTHTTL